MEKEQQEKRKPPLPADSIRRGYESVLDRCARLLSFAGSALTSDNYDIEQRQTALAIDDLIVLSLQARRLIKQTSAENLAENAVVPTLKVKEEAIRFTFEERGEKVSIKRLFGIIIHNEEIDLIRDSLPLFAASEHRSFADVALHHPQTFPAKLSVKSDISERMLIDLADLILIFVDQVFEPIIKLCSDKHLFLERSLTDM
jgi:hypothetical protein